MSTVSEIKSKNALSSDSAVTISVDVEALRDAANGLLEDAQSVERDIKNSIEKEWVNRRKQRVTARINERRRSVNMAMKFLNEVSGILDNATETLKKAK